MTDQLDIVEQNSTEGDPWNWSRMSFTQDIPVHHTEEIPVQDSEKVSRRGIWGASAVMFIICLILGAMIWHQTDWTSPPTPRVTSPALITHFPTEGSVLVVLPPGETTSAPPQVPVVQPRVIHTTAAAPPVVNTRPSVPPIKSPPTRPAASPTPTISAPVEPPDPGEPSPTPTTS